MIDINYFARKAAEAKRNPGPTGSDRVVSAAAGERPGVNGIVPAGQQQIPVLNSPDIHITFRGIVYPWHLDHMNHMNVQHYASMFDQSSWVLLALLGLDTTYFRDNQRGMAVLEQTIQYKSELRSGDAFEIRSRILEIRRKTIRVQHNMHKLPSGMLAASTTLVGVHIDTGARKSTPLPAGICQRARDLNGSMMQAAFQSNSEFRGGHTCVAQ